MSKKFFLLFFVFIFNFLAGEAGNYLVTYENQEQGPNLVYRLVSNQMEKREITLNNGSLWVVAIKNVDKVGRWDTKDVLTAAYSYRMALPVITLTNNTKQQSVWAQFVKQDEINTETTFIQEIDWKNVIITLNNGIRYKIKGESKWFGLLKIHPRTLLENWQEGDVVMVMLKEKSKEFTLFNTTLTEMGLMSKGELVSADYLEN